MTKFRFKFKNILDITLGEYDQIKKLTFGKKQGLMYSTLEKRHPKTGVILTTLNNTKKIVGWCMIDVDKSIYIYTHKEYRRRGIATSLYKKAKRKFKKLTFYSHDRPSVKFETKVIMGG